MRKIISILIISMFVPTLKAQDTIQTKKIFVRVFNESGNKIAKGKIFSLTDDAIYLSKGEKSVTISLKDIGYIRTKHSAGHNVLLGAGAGAAAGMILGAASADSDGWFGYTEAEGATGFGLLMGTVGAAVGGITVLFKNSDKFEINGDPKRWEAFQVAMIGED